MGTTSKFLEFLTKSRGGRYRKLKIMVEHLNQIGIALCINIDEFL